MVSLFIRVPILGHGRAFRYPPASGLEVAKILAWSDDEVEFSRTRDDCSFRIGVSQTRCKEDVGTWAKLEREFHWSRAADQV